MIIKVGIIGFGYWGPNLARNFNTASNVKLFKIADTNLERCNIAKKNYPNIEVTTNTDELIQSSDIDLVVIATPVSTHFELAMKALENGKHVWIEKPIASNAEEAMEIANRAEQKNLIVMVDHTYLFTGAVRKIKENLENKFLGKLYYYDSVRVNLGLFQHDVNVIWDLATHDFSIMNYLLGSRAQAVSAVGACHVNELEDVGYITVFFDNNFIGHLHVNWLSPVKIRKTLIGGSKKMLVWNDLEKEEAVKIYDKGVDIKTQSGVYDALAEYRVGDIYSPVISQIEALKVEVDYLIGCIQSGRKPHNDALAGLEVVKLLEAANQSIKENGRQIKLDRV
ncbi:MAG: Gfo/Idh/MocA family oxidoreductase [Nitrospinota bacterium]|nr:Gfo/Idh/MocA family oxidoreductase [Nitrospinota bacterium]